MPGNLLLSTAYLPPIEYFHHIINAESVLIEKEENYLKQSYRNRCYIIGANGLQALSVPVFLGSIHKTPVREIRIDYSKRWQQVHRGAIISAYSSSPFFIYYFESIEKVIMSGHKYLIDMNSELLETLTGILKIDANISFATHFEPVSNEGYDLRYRLSPKKKSDYSPGKYIQVFNSSSEDMRRLSIIDLIFNSGPEAKRFI